MATVMIHATVMLDGYLADSDGGVDWMFDFASALEDGDVVARVCERIGAIVGGANSTRTIEDGEVPYGGILKVPVFLMTHQPADPIERDGVTCTFVVDDIAAAVATAEDSLFAGLGMRVDLERVETSAFASETHLRLRVLER